jgi:hypothetical protein
MMVFSKIVCFRFTGLYWRNQRIKYDSVALCIHYSYTLRKRSPMKLPCIFIILLSIDIFAVSYSRPLGNNELYLEAEDPYYFDAGLYFSLLRSAIPTLDQSGERQIYRYMVEHIFNPNSFLIEVGTYPLPLAGAAVRKWAPRQYDRLSVAGANIVRAITESLDFKEPLSLSLFFGHVIGFQAPDSTNLGHGNIGLLCSYGYYHIKDNVLYQDHWGEFELKLKVDKRGNDCQYATSYRIGSRLHSEADIKDFFYLGLRRERTDFTEKGFSLVRNTNFQFRTNFSYLPLQVMAIAFEVGKKYPFMVKKRTYVLGLSLGITWNLHSAYRGVLADGFKPDEIEPIIRPLIKF